MIYFKKQFCEELHNENIDLLSNEEKIQNLRRLLGLAKSKNLDKDFLYKLIYEILMLEPKVLHYDKELFMELLSKSDKTHHIFTDHQKNQ